ncbi:MAG: MBOAT family O-acyltransferase [Pseudomonadota bacterium]
MVFNSLEFILIFLPICYFGFLVAGRLGGWELAFTYLGIASLVFYAQFSLMLVGILVVSVVSNYALGTFLVYQAKNPQKSGIPLLAGVLANLGALGYFKYSNFFIDVVNQTGGMGWDHLNIILPVGISFYTFIQIGYLVEAHGGQVKYQSFGRYLVFSTFFPCVTAGPLVLQREIFSQMDGRKDHTFDTRRLAVGLTLFAMGLFKKVVLADSIAPYANVMFDGVADGQTVSMAAAWMGSLAYTFQLYFDFSGYSDMAIGLGAIFGIKLPINFNSPFKATSISDFWRRWHMTMSRFFATYLFNPMAMSGMRRAMKANFSDSQRYAISTAWPLFFTMLIAGIWHGSGWTFVLYGALHGSALAIDHAWNQFNCPKVGKAGGWLMTMMVVVTGLVIFRAPDLLVAGEVLRSMTGYDMAMQYLGQAAVASGVAVSLNVMEVAPYLIVFGFIVLALPNTQQILSGEWLSSDVKPSDAEPAKPFRWQPNLGWSMATAVVFAIALTSINGEGSFLYYQF